VAGVVAGVVGGYFAGQATAPEKTVTVAGTPTTVTQTVTTTITAAKPEAPRKIKIGCTVSKTGMFAPIMYLEDQMLKAAAEAVNRRGGIYVKEYGQSLPVEIITYDDKSDVATVEKLYTKLCVEDNVDILIGAFTAAPALAASTVAEKNRTPYIDNCANEVPIYQRGYKYLVGQQDTVNLWYRDYFNMLKNYVEKNKGRKLVPETFAFLSWDDPFGLELGGFGAAYAEYLGFKVIYSKKVAHGTMDYTPYITELKNLDPDIVVLSGIDATAQGTFWKQCLEQGYKPRDLHANYGMLAAFRKQIPLGKDEGITTDVMYHPELPWSGRWGKDFYLKEVAEKVGYDVLEYVEMAYVFMSFEIACSAIEIAGTLDKDKINETLHTMRIMTIGGPWWAQTPPPDEPEVYSAPFKPPRGSGFGTIIHHPVQIQKGKMVILWPPELKTGEYIYPAPLG
jgi:branched-chain amino acid transport system substrate-binding protein